MLAILQLRFITYFKLSIQKYMYSSDQIKYPAIKQINSINSALAVCHISIVWAAQTTSMHCHKVHYSIPDSRQINMTTPKPSIDNQFRRPSSETDWLKTRCSLLGELAYLLSAVDPSYKIERSVVSRLFSGKSIMHHNGV